jgi:transposase
VRLPSDSLQKLKILMAFRDRLVKTRTSLKNTIGGLRETFHLIDNTLIIRLSQKQIKLVEQQIAQTEKEMQATIKQDQQLFEHFGLAKSVIGIGLIAASAILIHTQGLTAFDRTGAPERAAVGLLRRGGPL